jgi:hypothetical protein
MIFSPCVDGFFVISPQDKVVHPAGEAVSTVSQIFDPTIPMMYGCGVLECCEYFWWRYRWFGSRSRIDSEWFSLNEGW